MGEEEEGEVEEDVEAVSGGSHFDGLIHARRPQ